MFEVLFEEMFDSTSFASPIEPDAGGLDVVVETVDGVEPVANGGVKCAVDF